MGTHAVAHCPASTAEAKRPCSRYRQCPLAQRILCCAGAVFSVCRSRAVWSILSEVNHQLESRMREIRLSGSEGGGTTRSPYPYIRRPSRKRLLQPCQRQSLHMRNDVAQLNVLVLLHLSIEQLNHSVRNLLAN